MSGRVESRLALIAIASAWRELAAFAAAGWVLWPGMVSTTYGAEADISFGRAVAVGFLLMTGVALYAVRRLARGGAEP